MIYILTFLIAFLLALFLSPSTIKISEKLDIFSIPNQREKKTKPCLGGIAIFVACVVAFLSSYFFKQGYNYKLTGLIISSGLIFSLGFIDDASDLGPFEKIIAELIAIVILVWFGIFARIHILPVWGNILFTSIWVLFITNAFNLLDIVDGLTSGLVIIISLTLLAIAVVTGSVFSSIVLSALIGSHLGFLRYNYPPARLYMGDTGSLFSGFILAVASLSISYAPPERPIALVAPLVAMGLPVYDTLFLIIMRLKRRKAIFSKSNDHFAMRLLVMGYDAERSIWIMYLFSMFLAVSSIILAFSSNKSGIFVSCIVIMVFIFMGKKVGMVKVEDT